MKKLGKSDGAGQTNKLPANAAKSGPKSQQLGRRSVHVTEGQKSACPRSCAELPWNQNVDHNVNGEVSLRRKPTRSEVKDARERRRRHIESASVVRRADKACSPDEDLGKFVYQNIDFVVKNRAIAKAYLTEKGIEEKQLNSILKGLSTEREMWKTCSESTIKEIVDEHLENWNKSLIEEEDLSTVDQHSLENVEEDHSAKVDEEDTGLDRASVTDEVESADVLSKRIDDVEEVESPGSPRENERTVSDNDKSVSKQPPTIYSQPVKSVFGAGPSLVGREVPTSQIAQKVMQEGENLSAFLNEWKPTYLDNMISANRLFDEDRVIVSQSKSRKEILDNLRERREIWTSKMEPDQIEGLLIELGALKECGDSSKPIKKGGFFSRRKKGNNNK